MLATIVTLSRVVAIPFIVLLLQSGKFFAALTLYAIFALSDLADGLIARKRGITKVGIMADTIADKLFVLTFFLYLVLKGFLWDFLFYLLLIRDIIVTLIKGLALRRGKVIEPLGIAKVKTTLEMIAIGISLLLYIVNVNGGQLVSNIIVTITVGMAIISARPYLINIAVRK